MTRSVSSFFGRKSIPEHEYTTASRPRSYTWHIISHIFSFLWLAPIIALLVLNFRNTIVGSSAWCPLGNCPSRVWDPNAVNRAKELDSNDHNILGALQFIAKALEVWFIFIVTALIFDFSMIMARSKGGLPIGFLLTHLQFTDLRNLFNSSLWTAANPMKDAPKSQRKSALRLMMFGIFVGVLTVLANLMGPATAVLLIPTLRWVDTRHMPSQAFNTMHTDSIPLVNTTFWNDLFPDCDTSNLTAGQYGCSGMQQESTFDSVATWSDMTKWQSKKTFGRLASAPIQESAVQFLVNYSATSDVTWGMSRQVLREMSHDIWQLAYPETYGAPLTQLNDSLQVVLMKERPSIGFDMECNKGYETIVNVTDNKQVRCLSNWDNGAENYNKASAFAVCLGFANEPQCYRVGEGWSKQNKVANFWIERDDFSPNETAVDVFFSDQATFYNDTDDFHNGLADCLQPAKVATCDWDAVFRSPIPTHLQNQTRNVFTTSYSFAMNKDSDEDDDEDDDDDQQSPMTWNSTARLYCDAISYLAFPTYTMDTSLDENNVPLVRFKDVKIEKNAEPLVLDPSWLLLAWSIGPNGTIPHVRPVAQILQGLFESAWVANYTVAAVKAGTVDYSDWLAFTFLNTYFFTQITSIIPYDARNLTAEPLPAHHPPTDKDHPILKMWASRRVWAYGITGSRSSKLGVAVAILGVVCVLLRLTLGLIAGKREHSPVELMVAALEHHPTGEFDGIRGNVSAMAKVRYVMEEDEEGRARFVPERQYTGDFAKGSAWERRGTGLEKLMGTGNRAPAEGLAVPGGRSLSWRSGGGRVRGESVSTLVEGRGLELEGLSARAEGSHVPVGTGTPALGSGGWVVGGSSALETGNVRAMYEVGVEK